MNVPRPMAGRAKLIVGLTGEFSLGDELAEDDDDDDEFVVSVEPLSIREAGVARARAAKGLTDDEGTQPVAAAAYM